MNNINKVLSSLALFTCCVNAQLIIKPKVGVDLSMLTLGQNNAQYLPHLDTVGNVDLFYPATDGNGAIKPAANRAYFNPPNGETAIHEDNVDGVSFTQFLGGIELSYYDEAPRPSDIIQLAPIANIYVTAEDTYDHDIHINAYNMKSLTAGGIDLGLLATTNGNSVKVGGGARLFRGEFRTSSLFAIIGNVQAEDDLGDTITLDTTAFVSTDKVPYTATTKPLVIPYIYAEVNTEVGDVLSAFAKINYGFSASPEFDEIDDDTAMFASNAERYANNSDWQLHSVAVGVSMRVDF